MQGPKGIKVNNESLENWTFSDEDKGWTTTFSYIMDGEPREVELIICEESISKIEATAGELSSSILDDILYEAEEAEAMGFIQGSSVFSETSNNIKYKIHLW